jgi:uncharacterized protein YigE (DUF2233 family)
MIHLLYFLIAASVSEQPYHSFVVEKDQSIKMYWKDNGGKLYRDFKSLESEKLLFATNGGMFLPDLSPVGLYIENGVVIKPVNKANGGGNFCVRPNGVFYVTNAGVSGICKTEDFISKGIKYATQSGPMLVIDGNVSESVKNKNSSYFVRNGVGILQDGTIVFAISKSKVTLKEFAQYFFDKKCINALYLDGGISQSFPMKIKPEQHFGVIIGVTKNK